MPPWQPEDSSIRGFTISTGAFQAEYMNNPISEGKIFKNLPFGKVPPLKKFKFIVVYGDPAYSNSTAAKKNSTKAVTAMGFLKGTYYILKAFCAHASNDEYVEWFYTLKSILGDSVPVYFIQENNTLQNPFFEQVFMPLVREKNTLKSENLYIRGDDRKKGDKATRIEANLEPIDRECRLVFNEEEKNNPHMQELQDQFKMFELHLPYCADGPDCVEGGKYIIDQKMREVSATVDTVKVDDLIDKRNRM